MTYRLIVIAGYTVIALSTAGCSNEDTPAKHAPNASDPIATLPKRKWEDRSIGEKRLILQQAQRQQALRNRAAGTQNTTPTKAAAPPLQTTTNKK